MTDQKLIEHWIQGCAVQRVMFRDGLVAWESYGKYHGHAACLPHGKVRVVRHDIPDDSDDG